LHNPSNIQELLDELDHLTIQLQVSLAAKDDWHCRRAAWRRPMRVPCELWFLKSHEAIVFAKGLTRNVSGMGIGLIAGQAIPAGHPIEIKIMLPGKPSAYFAGLTSHCRETKGKLHEIGVRLYTTQNSPVFHKNVLRAAMELEWLREWLFKAQRGAAAKA